MSHVTWLILRPFNNIKNEQLRWRGLKISKIDGFHGSRKLLFPGWNTPGTDSLILLVWFYLYLWFSKVLFEMVNSFFANQVPEFRPLDQNCSPPKPPFPPGPPAPEFWNCFIISWRPFIPPICCNTLGSIIFAMCWFNLPIWTLFIDFERSPFLNRPIPPIFFTIWANFWYCSISSRTSRGDVPDPRDTRRIRALKFSLVFDLEKRLK